MRVVQTQHILLDGVQERRAAVYREAPGPDCGCIVRFRPPGLAWHPALDRLRPGHEPVSVGQPSFAEGLRLTRRAGEPATEDSIAGRGRRLARYAIFPRPTHRREVRSPAWRAP